jgi:hypothetical protein
LVRARTAHDRVRLAPDEVADAGARAPAPPQQPAKQAVVTAGSATVEKCINCEYYDRRNAKPLDGKAPLWGQCRRHSPQLNQITAKRYVVEGVWPLVRDDDWCGEWTILSRIVEEWIPDSPGAALEDASPADSSRARPAVAPVPVSPDAAIAVAALADD